MHARRSDADRNRIIQALLVTPKFQCFSRKIFREIMAVIDENLRKSIGNYTFHSEGTSVALSFRSRTVSAFSKRR
jgi:hypothetical protein